MIWLHIDKWSIMGSFLIIVIIVLRQLSRAKVPCSIIIILWQVLILRLIIPVSFSVQTDILNGFNMPFLSQNHMVDSETINQRVNPLDYLSGMTPETLSHLVSNSGSGSNEAKKEIDIVKEVLLKEKLVWIWGIGFIGTMTFVMMCFLKSQKIIRDVLPLEKNEWIDEWKRVEGRNIQFLVSDRITTPVTTGVFKHKIILPKQVISSKQELMCILTHESIHIVHKHVLWKRLALFAVCIHWFNPLVWYMHRLFNRDIEVACDEQVIKKLGSQERQFYALSLIKWAEINNHLMSLASGFGKNDIEERIKLIMKKEKKSKIITGIVLGIGVLSLSLSTADLEAKTQTKNTVDVASVTGEIKPKSNDVASNNKKDNWIKSYEVYGLTYDEDKEICYFNGKKVKFFWDKVEPNKDSYRIFMRPEGEICVVVVRDKSNRITKLKTVSQEEANKLMFWNKDWNQQEKVEVEEIEDTLEEIDSTEVVDILEEVDSTEVVDTLEEVDSTEVVDTLEEVDSIEMVDEFSQYKAYGLIYSESEDQYYFNNKKVKLFWDKLYLNQETYRMFMRPEGEIYVMAVRDKNNKLVQLKQVSQEEANRLVF